MQLHSLPQRPVKFLLNLSCQIRRAKWRNPSSSLDSSILLRSMSLTLLMRLSRRWSLHQKDWSKRTHQWLLLQPLIRATPSQTWVTDKTKRENETKSVVNHPQSSLSLKNSFRVKNCTLKLNWNIKQRVQSVSKTNEQLTSIQTQPCQLLQSVSNNLWSKTGISRLLSTITCRSRRSRNF